MDKMGTENDEIWIRQELIPNLIDNKILRLNNNSTMDVLLKSCEIKPLSSVEDIFMLTNCYKVEVILTNTDRSVENETIYRIVVKKTAPIDEHLYKTFDFEHLFKNEVNAYENVFPLLKWSSKLPQYYYSHNKKLDAAIVLSDFNDDGWMMSKAKGILSLDHIILAVKELGRFHGLFYGLKLNDPKQFQEISKQFEESRFRNEKTSHEWDTVMRIGPKRATRSVRNHPDDSSYVPESFLQKLEIVLDDPYNYQKRMVQPKEPFAVLCHGDYLRNNIAFKYDANENPIDSMMFDFQTIRYSSPMIDLSEFIATSTGTDVRTKNFDYIFSTYYTELIKAILGAVESDKIPSYFTYENFLREYALYMPYGLAIAGSFLPDILDPEQINFEEQNQCSERAIDKAYNKGGEMVDKELRALITDMYKLYQKLGLELVIANGKLK